jgi:hypothetical protein
MLFQIHSEVGSHENILLFTGRGRLIDDVDRVRQPSAVQQDNGPIALAGFR